MYVQESASMTMTRRQDQPQQANEERQRREERRGEGAQNRGEGEERGAETWEQPSAPSTTEGVSLRVIPERQVCQKYKPTNTNISSGACGGLGPAACLFVFGLASS